MPTLFTALQAHARARDHRKARLAAARNGNVTAQTLGILSLEVKAPKAKRAKDPNPKLSLRDRFKVRKKKGPRPHVIVVGGGFAGLAAAYELKSVGYRVSVFEAREKVGGRVKSRRDVVPGKVMEGGAELIGKNHLAWWNYRRIFGLKLEKLDESQESPPVVIGGWLLSPGKAANFFDEMEAGERAVNKVARKVKDPYQPWLTPGARKLDGMSLAEGLRRLRISNWGRVALLQQLEADNGAPAKKQSWLGNLAMIKGGGLRRFWRDTETHRCKGGNQRLAFEFERSIRTVHCGKPVRKIEIGNDGVIVRFHRGKPKTGSDVVLAVPPTMWMSGKIRIEPPLPKAYDVQFGKNVKLLMNVEQGAWDPEAPELATQGPIDLTWKGTKGRNGSRAGFVAFSGGKNARICARWRNKRKEYLSRLAPVFPRVKQDCKKALFMNWPRDKWTRGSYSFPKRGEVTRAGPRLREGFRERLHFAGEHTCYAFTGYMEGALRSGLRVAEQIARRDGRI